VLVLAAAFALSLPPAGLVDPGRSLGGVSLGATQAQVVARWGNGYGRCRSCPAPTWYFTYRRFAPEGAGVTFRQGRAVALFTHWKPPAWHTTRGLSIGSHAARITEVYGPLARTECKGYYALVLPAGRARTAFYVVDDALWGFAVMRPTESVCR
jgi:hypothetical protein